MNGGRRGRVAVLGVMAGLAAGYLGWLAVWGTLTGASRWDGVLGVVLGLFICAQPAANAVDLLFTERGGWERHGRGRRMAGWLALNLAVMAAGWSVIVAGAIRLARTGG